MLHQISKVRNLVVLRVPGVISVTCRWIAQIGEFLVFCNKTKSLEFAVDEISCFYFVYVVCLVMPCLWEMGLYVRPHRLDVRRIAQCSWRIMISHLLHGLSKQCKLSSDAAQCARLTEIYTVCYSFSNFRQAHSTLRKHAYSNKLKILPPKKWKFSDKKFWYFSYFCTKLGLWVIVRTALAKRF